MRILITVVKNHLLSTLVAVFSILIIAIFNFQLIRYFFEGELNSNLGSIEISYIQMAKFWVEGGGLWQPLWYLGYPWHVFYTPLLPALEVFLHQLLDFSFAHAYRVIVASAYVLVPVSTYLFVWQISKSKTGAFVSALFYSVVPSVIALLFSEVAADTLSGTLEPRRFAILVRWGEGPHTLALVFLPLFGLFLDKALTNRRFLNLLLASFFFALVALTNAVVVWAAFLLTLAVVLNKIAKKDADFILIIKRVFIFTVVSLGILAFWYNLPFISTFFREGGSALNNWLALFPWQLLVIGFLAFGFFLVIKKFLGRFNGLVFSIVWFLMLFGIVYTYYASGESRLEYAPQALRLNTEVDLALSVVIGAVVSNLYLFSARMKGIYKAPAILGAVVMFLAILALLSLKGRELLMVLPSYTKPLSAGLIGSIEKTAEYRVSKKLEELTAGTNQRVLAPGNYAFWLNFFADTPQIRGALYQSSTHYWPEHVYYQITNGKDANIALAWLKIANIGKLIYTTGASAEPFKDYKVGSDKFDAVLNLVGEDKGDIFYSVPLKNDLSVKVVDRNKLKELTKPLNAIDSKPIYAYVAWLEEKSERRLNFEKVSAKRYKISGEIKDSEAILFQQTYDSGWHANGGWKVKKDPLDFMVLIPKKSGEFSVDLVYTRPLAVYFGYLITLATLVYLAYRSVGRFFFQNIGVNKPPEEKESDRSIFGDGHS